MRTLASRIQERATQFISEQAKLQSLQDELMLAVALEQDEKQRTQEIRRNLLEVSHGHFGVEREICNLNEEIEECNRVNTLLRNEAQRLEESALFASSKMEGDIKNIYSPHDTSITLYYQSLDSAVVRRKRKLADSKSQDENVRARIRLLRMEEEHLRKDIQQLEIDINRLKQDESQSDMAITNLAKQVQESLSKRVYLRQSLKECLDSGNISSSEENS